MRSAKTLNSVSERGASFALEGIRRCDGTTAEVRLGGRTLPKCARWRARRLRICAAFIAGTLAMTYPIYGCLQASVLSSVCRLRPRLRRTRIKRSIQAHRSDQYTESMFSSLISRDVMGGYQIVIGLVMTAINVLQKDIHLL